MAADNFIKIDGIKGESTDDKHKDWIEILSYTFGVSQQKSAADASATASATSHRADFQKLTIIKHMDIASTPIFKACVKGTTIKEVFLELCRAGGDKQKYMEYKLTDAIISSVSTSGGSSGEATESVKFNFGKIVQTYTKIGRDGKPAGQQPAGWDLTTNKEA